LAVILATLEPTPQQRGVAHRSSRLLAFPLGLSTVKVARIWRQYGLQLWRAETLKFSNDAGLETKLGDVVELSFNSPDKGMLLCETEKARMQILEPTAGALPVRSGIPEKRAHHYVRHGTTRLFAALEDAIGKGMYACYLRYGA